MSYLVHSWRSLRRVMSTQYNHLMGTLTRVLRDIRHLAFITSVLVSSCSETGGYQVELRFESASLVGQTAWVRVELVDSCDPLSDPGTGDVVRNFASPIPVDVAPGQRHVRAWAYDSSCRLVGAGCTTFDAVSGANVTVSLPVVATRGPSDCSQCDPSVCDDADSGMMNQTCGPFEVVCDDLLDGDCDGLTDCQDPDCSDQTCTDDNGCTVGDTCVNFECVGTGMECNDDNPCTDNTCVDGACTFVDNSAPCDDGFWCNGTDQCGDGSCSIHSDSPCDQFCNESKQTCDQCAQDGDCGTKEIGDWTSCQFSSTCAINGTRTRLVKNPRCSAGTCTLETTKETGSCSRATTDGQSCGSLRYGTWSSCNYTSVCDQSATRSRAVYTPKCSAGSCSEVKTTQTENCSRSTNGKSCGTVTYSAWSSCKYSHACDPTGSRTRTKYTPLCSSGSCSKKATTETGSCSRTISNGKSCGTSSWQRCCSGTCRDLRTNRYCGGCTINCSSQGQSCVNSGTGGYHCTCSNSNAQCNSIYAGSSNTCYQNRCNCHCSSDGVCRNGGCGSDAYCHDCPGQNYCSPNNNGC